MHYLYLKKLPITTKLTISLVITVFMYPIQTLLVHSKKEALEET
jgi:hypothetical protein